MRILTLENRCFHLDKLPDEIEEDIRFSVLDNSNPKEPDFYWIPLIFLESFNSPAMVLDIGGNEITVPVDWHIAVGDSETGMDLEVLPLTSLNKPEGSILAFWSEPHDSLSIVICLSTHVAPIATAANVVTRPYS